MFRYSSPLFPQVSLLLENGVLPDQGDVSLNLFFSFLFLKPFVFYESKSLALYLGSLVLFVESEKRNETAIQKRL